MAVWREGTTRDLGDTAVDMTLRLDNARALPTYPQPHSSKRLHRLDDFNGTERLNFQLTDRPQWSCRLGPPQVSPPSSPHTPLYQPAHPGLRLQTQCG
jgi:hypothetical protein